jgi:predicted DNA-binding protein (UPF0251 family)/predicted Fe-Mo cluster-binding NifX family protein
LKKFLLVSFFVEVLCAYAHHIL